MHSFCRPGRADRLRRRSFFPGQSAPELCGYCVVVPPYRMHSIDTHGAKVTWEVDKRV